MSAPECIVAPASRDNQNGNGPGAFPNMYNWTLPNTLPENAEHCVVRMRYNITTAEFPITADASLNGGNYACCRHTT